MFSTHQRILGRNLNGTIAMTTQPSNESELQLYRVLQRANLLAYYDTFICQGGDDVQQLYEAGEEEFLEIMALVGMAAKPLHVRRLQKALHEWATNPALFQSPLVPSFHSNNNNNTNNMAPSSSIVQPSITGQSNTSAAISTRTLNNGPNGQSQPQPQQQPPPPPSSSSSSSTTTINNAQSISSPNAHRNHNNNSPAANGSSFQTRSTTGNQSTTPSPSQFQNTEYSQPCSPSSMTPILMERQIRRLAEAAEQLVKNLPASILDLKPTIGNNTNGNKKRIVKEIENIMSMSDDDPRRIDEIRRYAAIYGRFDCKRKPEKPLTLHEVSVNEAAAQICSKIPQLLYRRDELFPLARQVVRDSGYQYSKGHSRSQSCRIGEDPSSTGNTIGSIKRIRLDNNGNNGGSSNSSRSSPAQGQQQQQQQQHQQQQESKNMSKEYEEDRKRRHNRLEGIVDQLKSLGNQQEKIQSQIKEANDRQNFQQVNELQNELEMINDHQMQLVNEKSELEQQQQKQNETKQQQQQDTSQDGQKCNRNNSKQSMTEMIETKTETDDTDSQFSLYSNESMPSSLLHESRGHDDSPSLSNDNLATNSNNNNNNTINDDSTDVAASNNEKIANRKKTNGLQTTTTTTTPSSASMMINANSNDSMDFGKQLNDVIDEGLRLMGHVIDENIDLRLFNKYTEVLRNNNNNNNGQSSSSSYDINNCNNYRSPKNEQPIGVTTPPPQPPPIMTSTPHNSIHNHPHHQQQQQQHHRQRGRPPKNTHPSMNTTTTNSMNERIDLSNTFYEQLLSQAQIQQQMQLYQQSLYAQALFGDFNNSATTLSNTTDNVSTTTLMADQSKTDHHAHHHHQ
ncbi:hypothetical protein HUG17_9795 [Dermatophagoides farinae]|uniref:NGFI-A-binding protein homolog n=1 Tax=Dermatophagoides farinae TaxID=6954 RepID=A0A9D4SHW6_DERFA|nr:hypothetical protein HUG17_9795 [Dermatophagoides farinae]